MAKLKRKLSRLPFISVFLTLLWRLPLVLAAVDAPAGFDNLTNGFESQTNFDLDRATSTRSSRSRTAWGRSTTPRPAAECHQNPVPASAARSTNCGPARRSGGFTDHPGGSLINDRAIDASIQETCLRHRQRAHLPHLAQHARRRLRRGDRRSDIFTSARRAPARRHQRGHPGPGPRSAGPNADWPFRLERSAQQPALLRRRRLSE